MPDEEVLIPPPGSAPTVLLDAVGVTAWLGGRPLYRVLWSEIETVELQIATVPGAGYSEAFWNVEGGGAYFGAPVEFVVNGDELTQKLCSLPNFDMTMYRQAREAEAQGHEGTFLCWRKGTPPTECCSPQ